MQKPNVLFEAWNSDLLVDFVVKIGQEEIKCHKLIYALNTHSIPKDDSITILKSEDFSATHVKSVIKFMYKYEIYNMNLKNDVATVKAAEEMGCKNIASVLKKLILKSYPSSSSEIYEYLTFCDTEFLASEIPYRNVSKFLDENAIDEKINLEEKYGYRIAKYIETAKGIKNIHGLTQIPYHELCNSSDIDYSEYIKIMDLCLVPPERLKEMYLPFERTINIFKSEEYPSSQTILYFIVLKKEKDFFVAKAWDDVKINVYVPENFEYSTTCAGTIKSLAKNKNEITIHLRRIGIAYSDEIKTEYYLQ